MINSKLQAKKSNLQASNSKLKATSSNLQATNTKLQAETQIYKLQYKVTS